MSGLYGRTERTGRQAKECSIFTFFFSFSFFLYRGTHTPSFAHSATMREMDFFCCGRRQGPRPVPFVVRSTYPFGVRGQ
jgi:hypothetical protein